MGISFSVPENVTIPPSLKNIIKEIQSDVKGCLKTQSGDLTKLVEQGVFL
jgi:uracil-DNA glycosylase